MEEDRGEGGIGAAVVGDMPATTRRRNPGPSFVGEFSTAAAP
jgi:hypothetical protein